MIKAFIFLRSKLLAFLIHGVSLPVLKVFRGNKPCACTYTLEDLRNLPSGSLGNDLYYFLTTRQLDFLPCYLRHDLKHLLLGYDANDKGEVCLQCFMWGNDRMSVPIFCTIVYAFLTMPDYWKDMIAAYKLGKKCAPIRHWQWLQLLTLPTKELKNKIYEQH